MRPVILRGALENTGGTVTFHGPPSRTTRLRDLSSGEFAVGHNSRGQVRTHSAAAGRPSLSPLPAPPAVSATATACPGRGRDGRVPFTFGRQLPRPGDRGINYLGRGRQRLHPLSRPGQ